MKRFLFALATLSIAMISPASSHAGAVYTVKDLGTLSGSYSQGNGVNDSGQVTGYSFTTGDSAYHAFLSAAGGGALTDLGTLGGSYSYGFGVNASGQVVGYSYTAGDAAKHAFLFSGGVMTDLNSVIAPGSGFTLLSAQSISDTGYITGYGNVGGQTHAFLLTPQVTAVPEPATLASVGFGLIAGLGVALHRRRTAA